MGSIERDGLEIMSGKLVAGKGNIAQTFTWRSSLLLPLPKVFSLAILIISDVSRRLYVAPVC